MQKYDLTPFLSLIMLFSGAALLVSIYFHISLGIALALVGILAGCAGIIIWKNIPVEQHHQLKRTLLVGCIAGFLATLAYDASRFLFVAFGQLQFSPFETFTVFGKLIIGQDLSLTLTKTIGTAYHLLNGTCFGIAYCIFFRGKAWWWGIIWALLLEAMMLTVYPGWLNIQAILKEFVAVSVLGHVVYGSVLGILAQRFLKK